MKWLLAGTAAVIGLHVAALHASTTWWVNGSAAPGGSGTTQASPYQTIDLAVSHSASGDTINVLTGTYYEASTLVINKSLTIDAYPAGARVIVSGFKTIPTASGSWSAYSTLPNGDTVYTTTVGGTGSAAWNARDLYADMTRQQIARTAGAPLMISAYNKTTHTITLSGTPPINFSSPQSSFVLVYEAAGGQNNMYEYYIGSISNGGQTLVITPPSNDSNNQNITAGDLMYICNDPTLINGSGQFAYETLLSGSAQDSGTTTIYWDPGDSSNLSTSQARHTSYMLQVSSVQNVTLNGLELAGASNYGVRIASGTNITIENAIIHDNGYGFPAGGGAIAAGLGRGIYCDTATNVSLSNSIVVANPIGAEFLSMGGTSSQGLTVTDTEFCFADWAGLNLVGRSGTTGACHNMTVQNCYFHDQSGPTHADQIYSGGGVYNLTLNNNLMIGAAQALMMDTNIGVSGSNNAFIGTSARAVIPGHGNTQDLWFSNNTFALNAYGGISADDAFTTGTMFSVANSIFYRSYQGYTGQTYSDYAVMWSGTDAIANANTPVVPRYVAFYTAAAISGTSFLTGTNPNTYATYEANSVATGSSNPLFNNMPVNQALLISGSGSVDLSSTNTLVLDATGIAHFGGTANGFNVNDVIEFNNDGVARTILTSTFSSGNTIATITFTPALSNWPWLPATVWSWPAGTSNFVIDNTLYLASPARTSAYGGGQGGATLNTIHYQSDEFDGTSTRSTPVVPSDLTHIWTSPYWNYPYVGIP